jgi:uncharacterized protein involved in type VI secretion and phage assembly
MIEDDQLDNYGGEEQRNTRASSMNGLVLAEVTSNKDEENSGRIRVTYKWHSDENETALVGVSTLMGGNDRGSVFVPEVGDQVVCGFLNGDINTPVILGSLHGKEDKAPAKTDDGKNNLKMIKTRSGHTIIFNDEQSKESLTIKSKSDHLIEFVDTPGEEKVIIKDKTGHNFIKIDSVGNNVSINSKVSLNLEATIIKIHAKKMTIEADTILTVRGTPIKLN